MREPLLKNNFKIFCKSKYAISCGNGTDALTIALKSLSLPNYSEVIIPAMTYCSTAFAVINAGLTPILVDTEFLKPTIDLIDVVELCVPAPTTLSPVTVGASQFIWSSNNMFSAHVLGSFLK